MTVASSVAALVTHVRALDGLKRVWDNPPDNLNEFPCAIVYAGPGELGSRQALAICDDGLHTLIVEIYHARQILPQAVAATMPYIDSLFSALRASTTLYVMFPIRYQPGALQYGDATYYGVRFEITVRD